MNSEQKENKNVKRSLEGNRNDAEALSFRGFGES